MCVCVCEGCVRVLFSFAEVMEELLRNKQREAEEREKEELRELEER